MSFPGNNNTRLVWPPLTQGIKILLGVYFAVFIVTLFKGSMGFAGLLQSTFYLSFAGMFERFYLWQPLTYQLLHSDFLHLLFNGMVLYSFGGDVERRWGMIPFIRFVVVCGLGGAVAVILWNLIQLAAGGPLGAPIPVLGASGGIYGVVAAYALLNWNRKLMLLFVPRPIEGKWLLAVFVGIDLLFVLLGAPTSIASHLGGLACGLLIVTGWWRPQRILDELRLWRARRRLRLLRGGHPLTDEDKDSPGKRNGQYLH